MKALPNPTIAPAPSSPKEARGVMTHVFASFPNPLIGGEMQV